MTDSLPLPLGQTIWQTGQLEIGPHVQDVLVELGIEPADLQILGRFHTKRLSGEWQEIPSSSMLVISPILMILN